MIELEDFNPVRSYDHLFDTVEAKVEDNNIATAPYKPYGQNELVFYNRSRRVIIEGPAGTGKTRTALERIHSICMEYPNTAVALTRAVRATIATSVLKTFEDYVLAPGDPMKSGATRENRESYQYPNGSEIVIIGFNDPGKLLSTEWNLIYVNEADQVPLPTLLIADQRIRRAVGYQHHQLIVDLNPTYEEHPIYKQGWEVIPTFHQDNPLMMKEGLHPERENVPHPLTGAPFHYTDFGLAYVVEILSKITDPALRKRFYEGKRLLPHGLIYGDVYDPSPNSGHIQPSLLNAMCEMVKRGEATRHQAETFLEENFHQTASIDFNYVLPLSIGFYFVYKKDKVLRQVAEFYRTRTTIEDAAKICLNYLGWKYVSGKHIKLDEPPLGFSVPLPPYIVCDHDAEDRATLSKHFGKPTRPAMKQVRTGIIAVAQRFKDKRLLIDDTEPMGGKDSALTTAHKPACLAEEILAYKSQMDIRSGVLKETPVKDNDHACDRLRYMVAEEDGIKAITSGKEVVRLSEQQIMFSSFDNEGNSLLKERGGRSLFAIK